MAESEKCVDDNRRRGTRQFTNTTYPASGTSTYYSAVNRKAARSAASTTSTTSTTSATSADKPRSVGSLTYRSSVGGVSDIRSIVVGTREYSRAGRSSGGRQDVAATANSGTPPGVRSTSAIGSHHDDGDASGRRDAVTCQISSESRSPPTGGRRGGDDVTRNTATDGCRRGTRGHPNGRHQREINHTAYVDRSYRQAEPLTGRPTDRQTNGIGAGDQTGASLNGTAAARSSAGSSRTAAEEDGRTTAVNDRRRHTADSLSRDAAVTVRVSDRGDAEADDGEQKNGENTGRQPERRSVDDDGEYTKDTSRRRAHDNDDTSISSPRPESKASSARRSPAERSSPRPDDCNISASQQRRACAENESSVSRLESVGGETAEVMSAESAVYGTFSAGRPAPSPRGFDAPPVPPHRYNGHSLANKDAVPLPPAAGVGRATSENGAGTVTNHAHGTIDDGRATDGECGCQTETSSVVSDSLDSDRSSVLTESGYRDCFQERFYMNENSSDERERERADEAKLGSSPNSLEHPLLIRQRNILRPEEKVTKIVSNRGTIRGLKNLVKAGIATYAENQDKNKNYRLIEAGKVVVYTTSVKIIRETHDRCLKVKKILQTHMIKYEERDIFMSRRNQDELRERLGPDHKEVPQVFADGQHIGGLEELEALNESGELRRVFRHFRRVSQHTACERCGGFQYIPCTICHGSKKSQNRNYFTEEFSALRCTHCDENGLIRCDMCTNGETVS